MFPPTSPQTAGKVSDGDDEDATQRRRRRRGGQLRQSVCLTVSRARQIKRLGDRPPNDFSMDEEEDVREERNAGAST